MAQHVTSTLRVPMGREENQSRPRICKEDSCVTAMAAARAVGGKRGLGDRSRDADVCRADIQLKEPLEKE
jgi:hypothetical protein